MERKQYGAEVRIEIIPGRGHDVWSDEVRQDLHQRIDHALANGGL